METETHRLEIFRAIRTSIREIDSVLLVGIDIAKNRHHAFFGNNRGKALDSILVFENGREGFETLLSKTSRLRTRLGLTTTVFGMEPTSSYHKPLSEWLIRQGETVVLVPSAAVKDNRKHMDGRWDKHDRKDAANVADLVGNGRCLFYDLPDAPLSELRRLLVYRMQLKKQEHALRMRLRNNLFAQYFPELDRFHLAGEADELLMAVAEHCLDPRTIACLEFDEFCTRVTRRKPAKKQLARIREIWTTAKETIGCEVPEAAHWESKGLVTQFKGILAQRNETEARMQTMAEKFLSYPILLTIPGFGPIVSTMVLSAIGDPSRFSSSKQVLRLAGLDLCAHRSGERSDRARPVISKQGKASLRYLLVQAAIIGSHRNPTIRGYFQRRLEGREGEQGIRLKLHVKLAAKLLVVAWTMMKRREAFDLQQFGS